VSFFANLLRRGIGAAAPLAGGAPREAPPVREEEHFVTAVPSALSQTPAAPEVVARKASAPFVAPAPVVALPSRVEVPAGRVEVPPVRPLSTLASPLNETTLPVARAVTPPNVEAPAVAKPSPPAAVPAPILPSITAADAPELTRPGPKHAAPLVLAAPLRTLVVHETEHHVVERSLPAVASEPALNDTGSAMRSGRAFDAAPAPLVKPLVAVTHHHTPALRAPARAAVEPASRSEPAPVRAAPPPPVEVRIESIEILAEPAPTAAVEPEFAPRGFDDYLFARSYVRRAR
jgi:hypothetical protein